MKINDGEIRLGNGDVIPCEDISVDLSSDDPISNISRSDECEEISLGLHEGIVAILKKCLAAKFEVPPPMEVVDSWAVHSNECRITKLSPSNRRFKI